MDKSEGTNMFFVIFPIFIFLLPLTLHSQISNLEVPFEFRAEAIEKLSGAIEFKTITYENDELIDFDEFLAFHNYLEEQFPLVHEHLQLEKINQYSLLYRWEGTSPALRPILLYAHIDVVPIDSLAIDEWIHPPFSGVVSDGWIWGRGTKDDKGRLIAIMQAVEQLLAHGYSPSRTVYLGFGHDEEIGGWNGAYVLSELLESRGVQFEAVFDEGLTVTEGLVPQIDEQIAFIGIAEKGSVNLKLTVSDPGGHSSVPPPQNAIGILSAAIVELEANPFPATLPQPTRWTLEALDSYFPWYYRLAFRNLWISRPLVVRRLSKDRVANASLRTVMSATIIQGGIKYNVSPQEAVAIINIRIIQGETVENTIRRVTNVINDERVQIEVFRRPVEPSPVTPIHTPHFQKLSDVISHLYPEAIIAPTLVAGGTDSKHFTNLSQNLFRFSPNLIIGEEAYLIHGNNERLRITAFANFIEFYFLIIQLFDDEF